MTAKQKESKLVFSKTVEEIVAIVLKTFKQEIASHQLYYHGLEHVNGVARRALLIFDTVVPFYQKETHADKRARKETSLDVDWDRQRSLLYLGAIAHDMLQIFLPQTTPHTPRQRKTGESEKATVKALRKLINQTDSRTEPFSVHFTPLEIETLAEAIEATICQYDPTEGSIYQPWLYRKHRNGQPISLIARCLALADIGTLGIEGIKAYNREGSLLLLEENLDIIPFVKDMSAFDASFQENVRQRLLKRARFEVTFATGRVNRLDEELEGLPREAIAALKQKVFKYLTPDTIQLLEVLTPTESDTSAKHLIDYFKLNQIAI